MRAYVKYGRGAGEAALRKRPVPEPGPGEVLVQVAACGVCGSDLHAVAADPGYEFVAVPVTLGHELAGTVAAVGSGVTGWQVGEPVVAVAIQGCGHCHDCRSGAPHLCANREVLGLHRDGGMADYVVVRAEYLVRVPPGLALERAALAEPLSVAVHAVLDRSRIRPGDRVVVSGPGTIGLFSAQVARESGGEVLVVGTGADAAVRLPAAESLALATANLDQRPLEEHLRRHFGDRRPDVWIEASGAPVALEAAMGSVRRGGVVTVVGLYARPFSFFPTPAVRDELDLLFSYASHYPHYVRALDLLWRGAVDVEPLVHLFALDQAPAAFAAARTREVTKPLLLSREVLA